MISKLFFRLYVMVVLTLLGIGWSLDQVFDVVSDSNNEPDTYAAIFTLVNNHLAKHPMSEWPTQVAQLRTELKIPLALEENSSIVAYDGVMEDEWPESGLMIFSDSNGETLIQRINESHYALSIGPVGLSRKTLDIEYILTAIFYITLAIAIMLWVWPLWSNLRSLSEVTARFGQGEFNVRADVASKSAVAPLANTFNSMAARIQRLIDSHKELTSAVSHDLRTPLARMRFGIDMLATNPDETDKQRYMHSMQTDIDELDTLINEMLTYATFERDQPDLSMQSIQVLPWIEQIVEKCQSLDSVNSIDCIASDWESGQRLTMEPSYMARALTNLISNASRYAKTKIQVSVSKQQQNIQIFIDDDGLGIPEKERKIIFEAFKKIEHRTEKNRSGFGLGLAIVHKIVSWHGGHVGVTDSPLGGARFHVELPLQPNTSVESTVDA